MVGIMSNFNINDISDKDGLKALATDSVQRTHDVKLKPSIYYYTISRALVAIFEANSYKLPVQVWNEYRNSLDHLMRAAITNDEDAEKKQLNSSRGHLLRACLDITKLLCTYTDDWFKGLKKSKAYFSYSLVDNGSFLRDLEHQYVVARNLMINAKTHDMHLGNDSTKDDEIVDLYLDAYFAYKKLETMFYEKQGSSVVSKISYYLLYIKANWLTFIFSFAGKAFAALLIFLFGRYFDKLIQAWHTLVS